MKKFSIILLLLITMLVTTGFTTAEASYWEGMKEIYKWDALEGHSEIDLVISIPNVNQQYKLKLHSQSNLKDVISFTEIDVLDVSGKIELPIIKMYASGTDAYISRDAIVALLKSLGVKDQLDIKEEFILLKNDQNSIQVNGNFLQDMIKFIEEMDLGIDLGMIKEGNTYTLTLDSNKIVDLFDAYIKYIINNMDKMPSGMFPEEMKLTEEQKLEALEQYNNMIAPQLEMAKTFIAGSLYKQISIFEKDAYKEEAELFITSPLVENMKIEVKMTSKTKRADGLNIKLPTSVMTIGAEELNNLIISHFAPKNVTDAQSLLAIVDLEGNYAKLGREKIEEGKVKLYIKEGRAYIAKEDVIKLVDISSSAFEELIWIRDLNNYGYIVNWSDVYNRIEIYK